MGNPISGAYPVPGDLGQRLKGTEQAVSQLQRLMMKPTATPKPEVVGAPSGWTRVTSSAVVKSTSDMWFDGWTADATWDISPGPTPPVVSAGVGADSVLLSVAESGWYAVRYYLSTDVGGTSLSNVQVQGGNDAQGGYDPHMLFVRVPTAASYRWTGCTPGGVWLEAGKGLLALRMFWSALGSIPSHTWAEASIDVSRMA